MNLGPATKDLREQCSRPTADINHGRYLLPVSVDQNLWVRGTVSCWPHERVEARCNLRMGFQVFPERHAEHLVVGGSAFPDSSEQGAPCRGHAATEAIEIKAQTLRWVEQPQSGFVQCKLTGRWLL